MEQSLTIYKASAGSGKTFALAVEYIMELLQPHAEKEFEHTLAVTFTNKATAEMKGRILETLYGLKMKLNEARPYQEAIVKRFDEAGIAISAEQISQQAGKALNAILHNYSHFRVETIDSFFQSILRNMARELGLAANLQVELSHDEIVDSAVDSLIETMDTKPEVRKWVLDYVHEHLDSGDKWDIVGPLKAFAGNIFREEYQKRSEEELKRISDANVVGTFKNKMQTIKKKAENDVREAVEEVRNLIEDFGQISYGRNLESFLRKAEAMESEGPTKTVEQIKFKKPCAKEAEVQEAYARLLSIYPDCRRNYHSASLALHHLSSLLLLEYIDERAREIEGDAGRFTLSSTPALLSKMVEGSDAPFIFEKIGTYINNVMIDEFQDTSRMQWENFKKLLFEKLASGGKGLLVGDIKQSIYRWRNGDWKILYGIEKERDLQRFHIDPKPLDVNYRSHQVIVDFNNEFFPRAAALLDSVKPDAEFKLSHIYADVVQKEKKADGKGYVSISLFKETDNYVQDTITDMAEQIRNLKAGGLDPSRIAILVRTNKMAQQLVEGFSQFAPDIRLVSDEAFLLEASVSVQMIVAAMRMLIDKYRLRLSEAKNRLRLSEAKNHTDGISEKYLMLHYLYDVLGKKDVTFHSICLQNADEVLPEAFTAHGDELLQLPLCLLAERLWYIFSMGNIQGEDVYVQTFFDELQNHLRSAGAPDVQTFLNAWDDKLHLHSISGSSMAGVRILTIHKSKGLAFHTVMLPFSHWDIEKDRQGDVLWCQTDKAPFGELGALPISIQSKAVRTSVFSAEYEAEHLERRVDALNTLYVAFTRTACNLYVWGMVKPFDKEKEEKGRDQSKEKKIGTVAELIYRSLRSDEKLISTDVNDQDDTCFTFKVGTPLIEKEEIKEEEGSMERSKTNVNRLHTEHHASEAIEVRVVTRPPMLNFMQSNQASDYLKGLEPHSPSLSPHNPLPSSPEGEGSGTPPSGEDRGGLRGDGRGPLSQREIGKRMHEVLSRINDACEAEDVFSEARKEGIIGEDKDWEEIIGRITAGFADPLVASWFKAGNTVYSECAIASIDAKDGQPCVLRPDRVVMEGRNITVIDYKFGRPSRHYCNQVKEYMSLMKQMYPDHHVQGYIWYVMGKGAEQVYSS